MLLSTLQPWQKTYASFPTVSPMMFRRTYSLYVHINVNEWTDSRIARELQVCRSAYRTSVLCKSGIGAVALCLHIWLLRIYALFSNAYFLWKIPYSWLSVVLDCLYYLAFLIWRLAIFQAELEGWVVIRIGLRLCRGSRHSRSLKHCRKSWQRKSQRQPISLHSRYTMAYSVLIFC